MSGLNIANITRMAKEADLWGDIYTIQRFAELVAATQKKEWVGLTDREIDDLDYSGTRVEFARDIEAKLKEKNT